MYISKRHRNRNSIPVSTVNLSTSAGIYTLPKHDAWRGIIISHMSTVEVYENEERKWKEKSVKGERQVVVFLRDRLEHYHRRMLMRRLLYSQVSVNETHTFAVLSRKKCFFYSLMTSTATEPSCFVEPLQLINFCQHSVENL